MPPCCRMPGAGSYNAMSGDKHYNEWCESEGSGISCKGRVKCVLVGDGVIGKTSLIISYTTNGFPTEYVPTAFDNYSVVVSVDSEPIRLQICDTAGQDDFDSLRPLAYPGTDVFLLCFSVAIPSSFENVTLKWLPEIRKYCPSTPVILVGTQSDLRHDAKTSIELSKDGEKCITGIAAHRLANQIDAERYIESSALTQKNLKEVFDQAILSAIKHNEELEKLTIGRRQGRRLFSKKQTGSEKKQQSADSSSKRKKKRPLWRRIICFFK